MSIANNNAEYVAAIKQAHAEFPPRASYPFKPSECIHNYSLIIYCDGGDWDIARCRNCGNERVVRCSFDDDYC